MVTSKLGRFPNLRRSGCWLWARWAWFAVGAAASKLFQVKIEFCMGQVKSMTWPFLHIVMEILGYRKKMRSALPDRKDSTNRAAFIPTWGIHLVAGLGSPPTRVPFCLLSPLFYLLFSVYSICYAS